MEDSLKKKTVKGTFWSAVERFSVQAVQFVVMIFMARILTPADYGLVGMLTIFIAVAGSLSDSGISSALMRKNDYTSLDTNTVYYFNLGASFLLYWILFFCAPVIARFYDQPQLTILTRLISISLIINAVYGIHKTLLSKKIDFKTLSKASLIAAVGSGIVGIIMAYTGCGVWSLVGYQLSSALINGIGILVLSKWKPALEFSWRIFKEMFGFGSKVALTGIMYTIFNNIYLLVIGKLFQASELGYYTRANQFAQYPSSNVAATIQRAIYPILCTIQDDNVRLGDVYRRYLRVVCFIIFPLMTGLAVLSKPFILLLLNEKWLFSATLLSILCFALVWSPIHGINLSLLLVKGRSDLYLRLEIIKEVIGLIILAVSAPFGLIMMCVGLIVFNVIALLINTHYTGKILKVGFLTQMRDILPSILLSGVMAAAVFGIALTVHHNVLKLLTGSVVGLLTYIIVARIFDSKELKEIIGLIPVSIKSKIKIPFLINGKTENN